MNQEAVEKLFLDLKAEIDDGTPILVEGPEDEKALRHLGIDGRFVRLSKVPYHEIAAQLSAEGVRKIIILTDFDDYGEQSARKLKGFFLNESIQADVSFRKRFKALTGLVEFQYLPALLESEK